MRPMRVVGPSLFSCFNVVTFTITGKLNIWCVCAQPICMSFFQGVNTQASADPLNATDIATLIGYLFDNPNGMVRSSCRSLALLTHDTVALVGAVALHMHFLWSHHVLQSVYVRVSHVKVPVVLRNGFRWFTVL